MKKILSIIFMAMMFAAISACDSSSGGESCDDSLFCPADNSSINTCCTATNCRYVTATRTFNCNGTNCDSAAQSLVNFCGGISKTDNGIFKQLLIEKADNIVLKKSIDELYIDYGNELSQ